MTRSRTTLLAFFVAALSAVPMSAQSTPSVATGLTVMNAEHGVIENSRIIGWFLPVFGVAANELFHREGESIHLKHTPYCIGVEQIHLGAQFYLQTCNKSSEQTLKFEENPDKYQHGDVKIVHLGDFCMDMKAAAGGDPALVILWVCTKGDNQRWSFYQ